MTTKKGGAARPSLSIVNARSQCPCEPCSFRPRPQGLASRSSSQPTPPGARSPPAAGREVAAGRRARGLRRAPGTRSPPGTSCQLAALLHGDGLGEVPRLVDVTATQNRDFASQEL